MFLSVFINLFRAASDHSTRAWFCVQDGCDIPLLAFLKQQHVWWYSLNWWVWRIKEKNDNVWSDEQIRHRYRNVYQFYMKTVMRDNDFTPHLISLEILSNHKHIFILIKSKKCAFCLWWVATLSYAVNKRVSSFCCVCQRCLCFDVTHGFK